MLVIYEEGGEVLSTKKISDTARQLTLARKFLGLSQERVAFDTGVSKVTISHIETGDCDPQLSTVMKLADRYGLELKLCDIG